MKNTNIKRKIVELMGYKLVMISEYDEEKDYVYVVLDINNYEAVQENEYAPSIMVNRIGGIFNELEEGYEVKIQTAGYGLQTLEDYPKFLEANQNAFHVAQELQKEIDKFTN